MAATFKMVNEQGGRGLCLVVDGVWWPDASSDAAIAVYHGIAVDSVAAGRAVANAGRPQENFEAWNEDRDLDGYDSYMEWQNGLPES